jgi:hypothetical protein
MAKKLLELLRSKEFWFYYQLGEAHGLDEALVQRYAVRDSDGEGYRPVTFSFRCPKGYAIELEVQLEHELYTANLLLSKSRESEPEELGWWDEARWHPFALRWDELEHLIRYWEEHPKACPWGATMALLLLVHFVGIGVDERDVLPTIQARIASSYKELGLFSTDEVRELSEATLRLPTEDDYRWTRDETLGWVFGGEYPCYSIRNPEHSGGQESRFPFTDFRRLMHALGVES